MAFRLVPGQDLRESVTEVASEQIDRSLSKLSGKDRDGDAVHETRKALKRLSALLHLIKPAVRKNDFRRDNARLKRIAKVLSGVREFQAMIETVTKLEDYDERIGRGPVSTALRAHLEAKREAAEKNLSGSGLGQARKLLKEARKAFIQIEMDGGDFKNLTKTIEHDYRMARRAFHRAYEIGEDEAFHDWRRYVQRHWRQLLLVAPSWPKALRPQTMLARDLSDVLGEDHDLFVLAHFIGAAQTDLGSRKDVDAYLSLCRERQKELRGLARDMGARLLAEKPSSLACRLNAYWATASRLEKPETAEDDSDGGNVITLKR